MLRRRAAAGRLTPLVLVAFPALLWLDEGSAGPWASARLGYVFGLGFFAAGLYWIAAALFVDLAQFWWAVPFAVLGLPALLALLPAWCAGDDRVVAHGCACPALRGCCLFAVLWSVAEWLRGHVLTGLPVEPRRLCLVGRLSGRAGDAAGAAWVGIYGLSFVTVLAASLPALLGTPCCCRCRRRGVWLRRSPRRC